MVRAGPSATVLQVLVSLVERLALPPELRQKADRLLAAAAEAGEGAGALEEAVEGISGVIVEARGRLEKTVRETDGFLAELREEHRGFARRIQKLVHEVRVGAEARKAFGESVRAEAEGIRLTADELLERASSLKRALGVGVQGILGALEAQAEEERGRQETLERGLAGLVRELSSLDGAVREREEELRSAGERALADEVTGCPSRSASLDRVETERANCRAGGIPLCLFYLAVDGLSETRAAFGNVAGDQVLRIIAKIAAKAVEPTGFLGRHGASEFVTLVPGAELPEVLPRAEEIRKAVACFRFLSKGERIPISASVGLAQFREDEGSEGVFRRARRALKLAQERGGNVVATERDLEEG